MANTMRIYGDGVMIRGRQNVFQVVVGVIVV